MDYIKDARSAVVHIPTREAAAVYTLGTPSQKDPKGVGRTHRHCVCGATIPLEFLEYVDGEDLDVFKMCTTCEHEYNGFRERWGWND